MMPLEKAWLIQIEVTNTCHKKCAHCTRATGLTKKRHFADLEFIENALLSLKEWPNGVGCMGGEPTMHPHFSEICMLYQKYFPRDRCGLWTSGGKKFTEYQALIKKTFGILSYNEHGPSLSYHRPVFVASKDVMPNPFVRAQAIENCWLQHIWSPSITRTGAFFCEVAATVDQLFGLRRGLGIEKNWWKADSKAFVHQRDLCNLCGIAMPILSLPDSIEIDFVTRSTLDFIRTINTSRRTCIYSHKVAKNLGGIYLKEPWKHTRKSVGYYFRCENRQLFEKIKSNIELWRTGYAKILPFIEKYCPATVVQK